MNWLSDAAARLSVATAIWLSTSMTAMFMERQTYSRALVVHDPAMKLFLVELWPWMIVGLIGGSVRVGYEMQRGKLERVTLGRFLWSVLTSVLVVAVVVALTMEWSDFGYRFLAIVTSSVAAEALLGKMIASGDGLDLSRFFGKRNGNGGGGK